MTVINHMGHEYLIHDGVKIVAIDEATRLPAVLTIIDEYGNYDWASYNALMICNLWSRAKSITQRI